MSRVKRCIIKHITCIRQSTTPVMERKSKRKQGILKHQLSVLKRFLSGSRQLIGRFIRIFCIFRL